MSLGAGIANGIAAGLQGYSKGLAAGNALITQRQEHQLQAKKLEQLKYQQDTQTPVDDVKKQQEVIMKKNKLLSTKLTKQLTWDSFKAYNSDGNIEHINTALKDIHDIMPDMYDKDATVMKIDPKNDPQLVNKLINKGLIKEWGPKAAISFVKVIRPGQDPMVIDMNQLQASMGYTKHMTKEEQASHAKTAAIAKDESTATLNIAKAEYYKKGGGKAKTLNKTQQILETGAMAKYKKSYDELTTDEKQTINSEVYESKTEGVSNFAKHKDADELTKLQLKAEKGYYSTEGTFDKSAASADENKIKSNLDDTTKKNLPEVIKQLHNNKKNYTHLQSIISDVNSLKDKNIAVNVKTAFQKVFGADSKEALAQVNVNTEAGMFLVNFVKDMSGLSYTDDQLKTFQNLIGNDLTSDISVIKGKLKAFADYMRSEQSSLIDANRKNLPATTHENRLYKYSIGSLATDKAGNTLEFREDGQWHAVGGAK